MMWGRGGPRGRAFGAEDGHGGGHGHGHGAGRGRGHRERGRDGGPCDGRGERGERGRRGSRRLFDYGEMRLLLLAMIAQRPRHGYELIKEIEERFGGGYTPSPGVIYPTLAWLDDMGYARIETEGEDRGGRKLYRLTAEGESFLQANRAAAEELLVRRAPQRPGLPDPVAEAMQRLKAALAARYGTEAPGAEDRDPEDSAAAQERIAAAIAAAAAAVEAG